MAELAIELPIEPVHWRFTVHDYQCMREAGILDEDDRVELIDGRIVEMSPIGFEHAMCVTRLNMLLAPALAGRALVSPQNPVGLDDLNEPQPDFVVLRERLYSENRHPAPADVLLLIEVSDTSLQYDRTAKLYLYAQAGIPEYWIIDLPGASIERHTDPTAGRYRVTVRAGRGQEIESTTVDGLVIRTDEVLGSPA